MEFIEVRNPPEFTMEVEKNSKNMNSKIYNFSTMQNIRMQYEL